jgi:tRNA pseudouridine38-40 synthase
MQKLQRYFLEIAYRGTNYSGWQVQPNAPTIQAEVNLALQRLFKDPEVYCVGCGRTDAGVHASQYFLHFDASPEVPENFFFKINRMLGDDIAIKRVLPLHYNAHSRFDARRRTYHYHIHYKENPFLKGLSYFYFSEWDLDKMNEVVTLLLQYKDFSPLSKHNPDNKTTLCDISHALWVHDEVEGRLRFEISANRFLWNMVRMITGLSLMVGRGRMNLDEVKNVMDEVGQFHYIMPVPPQGLYLTKVEYPYL